MQRTKLTFFLFLLSGTSFILFLQADILPTSKIDSNVESVIGVVATVNRREITNKQLQCVLLPALEQLCKQYPEKGEPFELEVKIAKKEALEKLIEYELIFLSASRRVGDPPPYLVDREIKLVIDTLFKGDLVEFKLRLKESGLLMRDYYEVQKLKILAEGLNSEKSDSWLEGLKKKAIIDRRI